MIKLGYYGFYTAFGIKVWGSVFFIGKLGKKLLYPTSKTRFYNRYSIYNR